MKKKLVLLVTMALTATLMLTGCGGSDAGKSNSGDSSAPTSTNVDASWDTVKDKGEFIMGLDDSFPPMGFRDEKNEISGFDVDVAKEVSSRLGVTLKLQPINWDAKEQELNTGNIDCIWNGFTMTEERKQALSFTKPYMNNRQVLVVKKDAAYTKLADLEGKKLGLQAGSSAADALNASADFKGKLKEVVELDNNMTALMDLEKGGVDAVLMDEVVARYYITIKGKGYKVIDEALATEEYGVGLRKNDVALTEQVQKTLEEMAKDGKLAEISNKWFGKDITTVAK